MSGTYATIVGRIGPCTDEALARAAAGGDQHAFDELARRYDRILRWSARRPVAGTSREELHQAALFGLFEACRVHDPRRGPLRALAAACIANHVGRENQLAAAGKQRVLSLARGIDDRRRNGEESLSIADRLPAPECCEPQRIVEGRDELARIARALPHLTPRLRAALFAEGGATAKPRWHAQQRLRHLMEHPPEPPRPAAAPSFTPAQIERALKLVSAGASVAHAAFVVGADKKTVTSWLGDVA